MKTKLKLKIIQNFINTVQQDFKNANESKFMNNEPFLSLI